MQQVAFRFERLRHGQKRTAQPGIDSFLKEMFDRLCKRAYFSNMKLVK